jgi:Na+/melibiose symporter-like transporter
LARLPLMRQVYVALLWFALFAQWMTIVPIIVPDQVAVILGAAGAIKEGVSGTILGAGALVALTIAPIAGALSDRWRGPTGRRWRFLLVGSVGSCLGLFLLLPFGPGDSVWVYGASFLFLQLCWNVVAGAYAGLIPDVVPERDQGTASAWMNVMSILGTIFGNGIVAVLYAPGRPGAAIVAFSVLNLICVALTVRYVPEPPWTAEAAGFEFGGFIRSFWLDPQANRDFYWVLVTRLLANMGVWSVFTFLVFYLHDVIGIDDPAKVLPALLGAGAILAIPASVIGIRLSERYGIITIVRLTSWMMAGAALCYVLTALRPSVVLLVPVVLVYSAGYGAYQAVDWALALKVLPARASVGKDMGIWHISMVLPQIVGPASTGWLISGVKRAVSAPAAYTIAFALAAIWLSLSAALVGRVRVDGARQPLRH